MKITLYPGGSHNYEQVFLECITEAYKPNLLFTGRREGLQTRVRIVTTVPYLIETEGK